MSNRAADQASATVIPAATCTHCGCMCDDIELRVAGGHIVAAGNACPLGEAWLLGQPLEDEPECRIAGRPAALAEGLARAAELLTEARYPLVYGLTETTCEAQRVAVALADRLGAVLDTPSSTAPGPAGLTLHGVAEVTATLGEVRNRSDLILFWRADPVTEQPRHFERYSLDAPGMFVPRGRADRRAVVVDHAPTATAAVADEFVPLKPGADFEALWTLRAIVRGLALDPARVEGETGAPLAAWQTLAARMQASAFGVVFFGDELAEGASGYLTVDALFALVRDLNANTRFVGLPLRSGGNAAGASQVLTWQTGFPFAINLARGYPRYGVGDFVAPRVVASREADAVLVIGDDPARDWQPEAAAQLEKIPTIVVGSQATETARRATVSFRTAPYSLATTGILHRSDDIALPVRASIASRYPSDVSVLESLLQAISGAST